MHRGSDCGLKRTVVFAGGGARITGVNGLHDPISSDKESGRPAIGLYPDSLLAQVLAAGTYVLHERSEHERAAARKGRHLVEENRDHRTR